MEKNITLASYDGAKTIRFGGREYPFEVVDGFRVDKTGEISWISIDTNKYNAWINGEPLEAGSTQQGTQRAGLLVSVSKSLRMIFGGS